MDTFPLTLLKAQGDSSLIFAVSTFLVELQEVKLTEVQGSHERFYLSDLSTMSLQQLIIYSSRFPIPVMVPWRFLLH